MPDLPDGLTEEEFEEGKFLFSLDAPSGMDVEPGNTVSGEITEWEQEAHDFGGEEIHYLKLTIDIDEAFEITESISYNHGKAHVSAGLGIVAERFMDDPEEHDDTAIDPGEFFVGERVEFDVDETEEGFTEVATDTDGVSTLRPEGSEIDVEVDYNDSTDGDDEAEEEEEDDDDGVTVNEQFTDLLEEHIGEEEDEIKKALAKEGSQFVKAYKEVRDEGSVEFKDGILTDVDL